MRIEVGGVETRMVGLVSASGGRVACQAVVSFLSGDSSPSFLQNSISSVSYCISRMLFTLAFVRVCLFRGLRKEPLATQT